MHRTCFGSNHYAYNDNIFITVIFELIKDKIYRVLLAFYFGREPLNCATFPGHPEADNEILSFEKVMAQSCSWSSLTLTSFPYNPPFF